VKFVLSTSIIATSLLVVRCVLLLCNIQAQCHPLPSFQAHTSTSKLKSDRRVIADWGHCIGAPFPPLNTKSLSLQLCLSNSVPKTRYSLGRGYCNPLSQTRIRIAAQDGGSVRLVSNAGCRHFENGTERSGPDRALSLIFTFKGDFASQKILCRRSKVDGVPWPSLLTSQSLDDTSAQN